MTKIKIAHIATTDISIHSLLLRQLLYLINLGFDVSAISHRDTAFKKVQEAGIRHISIPLSRRITPYRDIRTFVALCRILRKEQFDIVHTHTLKANVLGQLAARFVGSPVRVSTVHGLYLSPDFSLLKKMLFVFVEKVSAMFADIVFLVNNEDVRVAQSLNIIPARKIRLLEGGIGIDVQKFDRSTVDETHLVRLRNSLGLRPENLVIGFVGRLVREKGLFDLFEVAKRIKVQYPHVRFLIVGGVDTEKQDAVRPADAEEFGVQDVCIFTGEQSDTPLYYSLMDIFFLPTHREGFGLVLAEASAMRIPVVASDLGGCRQAVENERSGFLLPIGDIDGFTKSIMGLLLDAGLRIKIGRYGEQLARQRFDDRIVNEFVFREYCDVSAKKGIIITEGAPSLR